MEGASRDPPLCSQRRRAQSDAEAVFELSSDIICVVGFDGCFRAVNPAFEATLGYSPDELLARPFMDFVHQDDRQVAREFFRDVVKGVEAMQFETRYVARDGSERWFQWSSWAVPDQRVVYSIARDVTESRHIAGEQAARAQQLADEQEALRRVATLVAQGASAAAVFDAIAAEMERLLGADGVTLSRYEPDDELTFLAHRGIGARMAPPGTRVSLTGESVASKVRRTRQPARMEDYGNRAGAIAELVRDIGVRSAVGAPIMVEGRLWGLTVSQWGGERSPPVDTEERMVQFAELLGTAIANADSRDLLTASRARLLTEADDARRRVVRDLHDGAQQRLVHTVVTLKLAQSAFHEGDGAAERLVDEALQHAERGIAEMRELAHGILPAPLTYGGLEAGIDALVERLELPVHVELPSLRLAAEVEASAYFIVAEALTNIVKHSRASRAEVTASVEDDVLQVDVRDDGVGGADPTGHGLVGMADRVTALGGQLTIDSPADSGTQVRASFPLSGAGAATGLPTRFPASPTLEPRAAWDDRGSADLRATDR